MESQPREILPYPDANGNYPFEDWLARLRDRTARVKIQTRLGRLSLGNFGQVGSRVILLLCGGDKSSQERDIQTAKSYWRDYAKRQGQG